MSGGWCTIESDPGVFSELLHKIGVRGAYVEEVWSLEDQAILEHLKPIYGLIFLFKWVKGGQKTKEEIAEAPHVFFAKQTVENACATQAILNIIFNCTDKIDVGSDMKTFLEITQEMTPEDRGMMMGEHDTLRLTHNAFARHQNFSFEDKIATEEDEAYHFIAFVPKDGTLYELDGLQAGPVACGPCTEESWLETAKAKIEERCAKYGGDEIRFNLLAVCRDPADELQKLKESGVAESDPQLMVLKQRAAEVEEKRRRWSTENERRRHNYIPFIVNLLKALSSVGALDKLVEQAKEKTKVDRERNRERKAAKKAAAGEAGK